LKVNQEKRSCRWIVFWYLDAQHPIRYVVMKMWFEFEINLCCTGTLFPTPPRIKSVHVFFWWVSYKTSRLLNDAYRHNDGYLPKNYFGTD
jgi:hypothetical protein